MSNKIRHPDTCPTCDYFPCRCPGGGGADEEKNQKSEHSDAEKGVNRNIGSFIHNINHIAGVPTPENHNELMLSASPSLEPVASAHNNAEEIQNNRPAWCTFFAENAKRPLPTPSSNLQQDDSANNTLGMRMSMCGTDE
jgi:hypothetical protein